LRPDEARGVADPLAVLVDDLAVALDAHRHGLDVAVDVARDERVGHAADRRARRHFRVAADGDAEETL
jgi:hypothetical protein